jgi:hypothetical protein
VPSRGMNRGGSLLVGSLSLNWSFHRLSWRWRSGRRSWLLLAFAPLLNVLRGEHLSKALRAIAAGKQLGQLNPSGADDTIAFAHVVAHVLSRFAPHGNLHPSRWQVLSLPLALPNSQRKIGDHLATIQIPQLRISAEVSCDCCVKH